MGRLDAADAVVGILLALVSVIPVVLAVWIIVLLFRIQHAIAALTARCDALEQRWRNQ